MLAELQIGAVRVPVTAMEVGTARSSGPGGQNVNKVSSKVDLRVDLALVEGLSEAARERLLAAARVDGEGRLQIVVQVHRQQGRNLDEALQKLEAMIRAALVAPKRRRPTRPTRASKERRLAEKKRNSERKRDRGD